MESVATHTHRLTEIYFNFWTKIVGLTERLARSISREDLLIYPSDKAGGLQTMIVESKLPFWFLGLTSRREQSFRTDYDVALEFKQKVVPNYVEGSFAHYETVYSTIRMVYMDCLQSWMLQHHKDGFNRPKKIRTGIHFDLINQAAKTIDEYDHPIFHANFDVNCIDRVTLQRPDYEPPSLDRIDSPRIPSAPIDLGAAVFLLLRDHLPSKVETGWPDTIRESINALPRFPKPPFLSPSISGNSQSYTLWYNTNGGRE